MSDEDKNWKLKLRYGKLKTPFQHFTLIADGIVGDLIDGVLVPARTRLHGDEGVGVLA